MDDITEKVKKKKKICIKLFQYQHELSSPMAQFPQHLQTPFSHNYWLAFHAEGFPLVFSSPYCVFGTPLLPNSISRRCMTSSPGAEGRKCTRFVLIFFFLFLCPGDISAILWDRKLKFGDKSEDVLLQKGYFLIFW